MHRLINRYILREIAVPFCMILFVLTFVLLMGKILQVMDLMINKGIAFTDIARLMLFLMPSFLAVHHPHLASDRDPDRTGKAFRGQ